MSCVISKGVGVPNARQEAGLAPLVSPCGGPGEGRLGCMDPAAANYDAAATVESGGCVYLPPAPSGVVPTGGLYPWPDPFSTAGGPFYPATDLPDAITFYGTSLPRSGYGYGNTTNGIIAGTDGWIIYRAGVPSRHRYSAPGQPGYIPEWDSLILNTDTNIVDQFLSTYTITGEFETVVVTRTNTYSFPGTINAWAGMDTCGNPWILGYDPGAVDPAAMHWYVQVNIAPDCPGNYFSIARPTQRKGPLGVYTADFGSATVS